MYAKRLGLGILTTLAAMTLAACDNATTAPAGTVVPGTPSFARGGKPRGLAGAGAITISPSTLQLPMGSVDTLHITYTDSNGTLTAEGDGRVFWYGCKPVDPAVPSCLNRLGIMPVYPTLRYVQLKALAAGVYTVWVDDGTGRTAESVITVP